MSFFKALACLAVSFRTGMSESLSDHLMAGSRQPASIVRPKRKGVAVYINDESFK